MNNNKIRKISVGPDIKTAMHHIVGQETWGDHTIYSITQDDDGGYLIHIEKNEEILIWKHYNNNMPISVEFDLEY